MAATVVFGRGAEARGPLPPALACHGCAAPVPPMPGQLPAEVRMRISSARYTRRVEADHHYGTNAAGVLTTQSFAFEGEERHRYTWAYICP